ncbi:MAG: type II secretion system F family protein [Clostridium perfringens]|nr:type II secretion system F family protein [Clostridium perfringens]
MKKFFLDNSLVIFCSNLNSYISSGIPMKKALSLVKLSLKNKVYKESIDRIIDDINNGKTLSESIKSEDDIYDDILSDLISIGEESGNLDTVLEKLSNHYIRRKEFTSKLIKILIYPIFLISIVAFIVIFYLLIILPSFKSLYDDLQGKTSKIINIIINYLNFIEDVKYSRLIVLIYGIIFLIFIYLIFSFIRERRFIKNNMILKLYYENNLIFIIELIVTSGVSLNKSLDVLSENLKSSYLKENIQLLGDGISSGKSLSEALKTLDCMSDIAISFIFSGEESGRLEENIKTLSKILEKEFDEKISMITKLLEPMVMIILGGIVVFMMVLIFIPIYGCIKYV